MMREKLEEFIGDVEEAIDSIEERAESVGQDAHIRTGSIRDYIDKLRALLAAEPEPSLRDSQRLDWIEHVMTYDDNYVEVYLSGLRNQTGKATAFQVEVNPEKIATLNAPTLREAIDAAQGKWEREVTEEHAARTPPPADALREAFIAGAWWHLMGCHGALTHEKAHDEAKRRYSDAALRGEGK